MKLPKIKIIWTETGRIPVDIYIEKLTNGYKVGNTYFATREEMIEAIDEWMTDPYADYVAPRYSEFQEKS